MAEKNELIREDNQFWSGTRSPIKTTINYTMQAMSAGGDGAWFGPFRPVAPYAPQTEEAGVKGRAWDYPTGYNLNQTPRAYEPVTFADLRGLARNCDIMRLVIETRKDQLGTLPWQLRVKAEPGQDRRRVKATLAQTDRIKAITEFMESPDKELSFEQWTRAFMEDHFVLDAPCVYRRPTRGGKLYALELIDGTTIMPRLTPTGRRPLSPDVAYQQILHGVVATSYTADELYYAAKNVTTHRVYGYPPVEQVLITANIAVRRAMFQLEYYTKGTQPDAFLGVPETWTMDQVKTFQGWLDNLQHQRRMLRAIPGKFDYKPTKEALLKDEFDDYLNRLICFAFSVSPTALVKMTNRAVSDSQHDAAIEEGNGPTMRFYESFWSKIVAQDFDSPDLEFCFNEDLTVDPKEQAEIDKIYVSAGIESIDGIREMRGKDAFGGIAGTPMVLTPNGYVSLGANVPVADGGDMEPAPEPAPVVVAPGAVPGKPPKAAPEPDKSAPPAKKLEKIHHPGFKTFAPASAKRTAIVAAKKSVAGKIGKLLAEVGRHAAKQATALSKAGEEETPEERAARIAAEVDLSTMTLVSTSAQPEMIEIAKAAGYQALAIFGVSDNDSLVGQVNEAAVDYARERAAYLVGKRVLDDGSIIDNPDTAYSITEATRTALRSLITQHLSEAKPMPELAAAIEADHAFSEKRARIIADTEVANANSAGALAGYRASEAAGNTIYKVWSVADDSCCDDCELNEEEGPIPLDDLFPSGDDAPLAHPNCRCVLLSATKEEGD